MKSRGVPALVRGWVGLYTRGMPAAVRAARRDEVDDDLWCQQQEAVALSRAAGSPSGEMLLRLLFGIPADISWRLSNRSRAEKRVLERSSSMGARVIGIFAILAGASWTTWVLRVSALGESAWAGSTGPFMNLLFYCGALGLLVTALSLAWRFQEQLRPVGIAGALAVSLGAFTAVPPNPLSVLLPAGSALLVWDLARISVLPRWIAIVHAASGVGLLVAFIGILIGAPALGIAFALAIPYLPSWIAIGASLLLRGVPQAHEPAAGT
jgi:hypothetical protein